MTWTRYIKWAIIPLTLYLVTACAPWVQEELRQPVDQVVVSEPFDSAQGKVPFHVPRPRWLPFPIPGPIAYVMTLGDGAKRVETTYASDDGTVTIIAINRADFLVLSPEDRFGPTQVRLAGGERALFMDNGTAQILQWTREKISYGIVANPGASAYTPADLVKIADSFE